MQNSGEIIGVDRAVYIGYLTSGWKYDSFRYDQQLQLCQCFWYQYVYQFVSLFPFKNNNVHKILEAVHSYQKYFYFSLFQTFMCNSASALDS